MKKEAIDLQPIIRNVRLSLDRFQGIYEGDDGDITSALLDLKVNFEDLEDAVDKNDQEPD